MHVAEHGRILQKRAEPRAWHHIIREGGEFGKARADVLDPAVAALQLAQARAELFPDVSRGIRDAAHKLLQLAVRAVEAKERIYHVSRSGNASAHDVAHPAGFVAEHGLATGQTFELSRGAQFFDFRHDLLAQAAYAVHEAVAEEGQFGDDLAGLVDVVGLAYEIVQTLVELLETCRHLVRQVVRALDAVHGVARGVRIGRPRLQAVESPLDFAQGGLERAQEVVRRRDARIEVLLAAGSQPFDKRRRIVADAELAATVVAVAPHAHLLDAPLHKFPVLQLLKVRVELVDLALGRRFAENRVAKILEERLEFVSRAEVRQRGENCDVEGGVVARQDIADGKGASGNQPSRVLLRFRTRTNRFGG